MKIKFLTLTLMAVAAFAQVVETKPAFISRSSNPRPTYLDGVIRNSGIVKCRVTVDEAGRMAGIRVVAGRADLVRAALRTVADWRFEPAVRNGLPVQSEMEVEVRFQF
jgi:periplasmic protein TonB